MMRNWHGKAGDIWLVNLDPSIGSEIQKSRPCVVISPPELHDHLRTVIIAPMSTGSRAAPFRVPVRRGGKKPDFAGLNQDSG
jgi:mRNA interferase MazF